MIYVTEEFENIYGKMQYRTLYKGECFNDADKVFKNYLGNNKVELFGNDGELIAISKPLSAV